MMRIRDSEISELFDYEIEIGSNEDFGRFWAIVEDFYIPESFVSEKGVFMFRIGEDDKDLKDTWLLVVPSDIKHLCDFLLQKKTYGDFLKLAKKLYLVVWDLQEFSAHIEKEVSLRDVEKKVVHIWNCKVFPEDIEGIQEIVDLFKQHSGKSVISYSDESTILKTYINNINDDISQKYIYDYQNDSSLGFDGELYLFFTELILNIVGDEVDGIDDLYDIAA